MVSLADPHCTSPRELQALEPYVQVLVQDLSFCEAVRDARLHSAALAAVRLLKPHLAGSEFKRPADRRTGFSEADGLEGPTLRHAVTSPSPGSLVLPRPVLDPRLRQLMHSMRQEALQIEDLIPWNSVRRTWRNKRSNWRRQVKQAELVTEMAVRLKELRAALLTDDAVSFVRCGQAWRVQLEACIAGRGSHHSLVSVWEELKASIKAWLGIRDKPVEPLPQPAAPVQLHPAAVRAVQAMQAAVDGESSMLQVPLEGILNYSREGLISVQQAIDFERRLVAAQRHQAGNDTPASAQQLACDQKGLVMVSCFSSINAGWEDSEFDSHADSDCGSDTTDMDSDFD